MFSSYSEPSARVDFMIGDVPKTPAEVDVSLRPACDLSLNTLAGMFNRSYSNYFIPVHMDASTISWLLTTQTIDLASSHVLDVDGQHAGFIFISARGLSQRVAAMGVIPEYRGMGYGQRMLEHCIEHAKDAGIHRMVLEVIDENAHALAIYRQLGFEVERCLVGYKCSSALANGDGDELPDEIDPREVAKAAIHEVPPGLPWQISAEGFFSVRPPSRFFTMERSAYAIISHVTDTSARINAIVVPRTKRRKDWGRRILRALYRL
ncbi:MAG TPA: GNAT family N-acetyltransferase [Bacteroidetes bacterium]|nr:GNAT family N-acetyltransferase [Bacteroidota bacterium]HEX05459.1 GNAT family N-acetyltransferase [Bacteroidota bacterium]